MATPLFPPSFVAKPLFGAIIVDVVLAFTYRRDSYIAA